jgi:hypothetical protein
VASFLELQEHHLGLDEEVLQHHDKHDVLQIETLVEDSPQVVWEVSQTLIENGWVCFGCAWNRPSNLSKLTKYGVGS